MRGGRLGIGTAASMRKTLPPEKANLLVSPSCWRMRSAIVRRYAGVPAGPDPNPWVSVRMTTAPACPASS